MKFLKWFVPSFEGHDGKASFRRLSAFVLLGAIVHMTFKGGITTIFSVYALCVLAVTFLMLVGIITADTLTQILKGRNIQQETNE